MPEEGVSVSVVAKDKYTAQLGALESMALRRGFESLVRQGIFLPESAFSADYV